jgi:radical SAM superfamily enzyme YgiQ (UPF0313 family)
MRIVLTKTLYPAGCPPIGLGYLSAYLKKHGFNPKIIDANVFKADNKKLVELIMAENPDVVGISCLSASYNQTVELCQMLKKQSVKCIIGGVHPTFLPYQTLLDTKADFVICGEGEVPLLKLIQNNLISDNIPGVYSLQNLKSAETQIEMGERVEDLDLLPFVDWEQLTPGDFQRMPQMPLTKSWPVATVITTRGCPYNCSFCASAQFYERKIRFRSPKNVVDEIEYLVKEHGVKEINFVDDNLTLNRKHIEGICKDIINRKLDISWATPNGIRADKIDRDLLVLMKQSGCYLVYFGIESAHPKILKDIKKSETIEDIENAISLASELDIMTDAFFIFGLPGETLETIDTTIDFAVHSKLSRAHFFVLDILPGCNIWRDVKKNYEPNYSKKAYYEAEIAPDGLTPEILNKAASRAYKQFYTERFKSPSFAQYSRKR